MTFECMFQPFNYLSFGGGLNIFPSPLPLLNSRAPKGSIDLLGGGALVEPCRGHPLLSQSSLLTHPLPMVEHLKVLMVEHLKVLLVEHLKVLFLPFEDAQAGSTDKERTGGALNLIRRGCTSRLSI